MVRGRALDAFLLSVSKAQGGDSLPPPIRLLVLLPGIERVSEGAILGLTLG